MCILSCIGYIFSIVWRQLFLFCITFYTSGFVRADVIQYLFLTMKPLDISLHSRCVRCERVVSVSFMCTNMYENTNKMLIKKKKQFNGCQISIYNTSKLMTGV